MFDILHNNKKLEWKFVSSFYEINYTTMTAADGWNSGPNNLFMKGITFDPYHITCFHIHLVYCCWKLTLVSLKFEGGSYGVKNNIQ